MEIYNKFSKEKFAFDLYPNSSKLNSADQEYNKLLVDILENGIWKENRTGIKTLSIFGTHLRFRDVERDFPLITTKKVHFKSVLGELLWFISGNTDKNVLREKYGTTIWDEWESPDPRFPGDMGPIYGKQWVSWKANDGRHINQLQGIIDTLRKNPDDRRLIVSAWNPGDLHRMALAPCHRSFQFGSTKFPGEQIRTLDLLVDIRSWDTFLGAPFNISSYAVLLKMMAKEVGMKAGDLIINSGDTHIYENHIPYVLEQLSRPSKTEFPPNLLIRESSNFWNTEISDFQLENYEAWPNFKNVPVAV